MTAETTPAMRIRVVELQFPGTRDLLVLGTDQIVDAARHLPSGVTRWGGSFPGRWARRNGGWRRTSELAKDGRPAVLFMNVHVGGEA